MKKLILFVFIAMIAAFKGNAALFITNNTGCDVTLILYGHDVNNPGPCACYTTRLPVAGGTSFAYNNVTSANTLGWYQFGPSGGAVTMVNISSGWDGVGVLFGGFMANIGNPGSCASTTSYTATSGGCTITATWTVVGSNVFVDIN